MPTFLHAADIHLDSPLVNLTLADEEMAATVRGATRRAFVNLIDLALAREVDFLLIAGDLYDGPWRDFNTGLFFIGQMRRLRQAGIRVFLIAGNHDAASRITRALRLPDNVTLFPAGSARTEILDEAGVAIHGRSYGRQAETGNLAQSYPDPVPGLFNIGLLHTALSGREGHAPYAPCTLAELQARGYEYWALGHIHQHEVLCREPWVVFAGNLQGRHIREAGPRGCYLGTIEGGRLTGAEFVALDVVRWQRLELDCADLEHGDDLRALVQERLEEEYARAEGRPLLIRIVLTGACPLHGRLLAEQVFWENELRGLGLAIGELYLETLRIATHLPERTESAGIEGLRVMTEDAHSLAADLVEELFAAPALVSLGRSLPPALPRGNVLPDEEQERRALLAEAADLALAAVRNRGAA